MTAKKIISTALLTVTLTLAPSLTSLAAEKPAEPAVRICAYTDCEETGTHTHGHTSYDTSGRYSVCTVKDCTEAGLHEHDGISYGTCQNHDGGTCTGNKNCTVTGHNHEHSNTTRSGSGHHGNGHRGGHH